jgi:hypothetical protein
MWRKAGTRVTVALAAGLALMTAVLVVTLSGAPLVVARVNSTLPKEQLATIGSGAGACQADEVLPAGTSTIRLTLWASAGPRLKLSALSGAGVLTTGTVGPGWTSGAISVPVRAVARTSSHVRICFSLGQSPDNILVIGSRTSADLAAKSSDGSALPGRIKIEYLRPAAGSWWSVSRAVARRMGLARAPSGTWTVLLLIVSMGAIVAIASWLTLKELR